MSIVSKILRGIAGLFSSPPPPAEPTSAAKPTPSPEPAAPAPSPAPKPAPAPSAAKPSAPASPAPAKPAPAPVAPTAKPAAAKPAAKKRPTLKLKTPKVSAAGKSLPETVPAFMKEPRKQNGKQRPMESGLGLDLWILYNKFYNANGRVPTSAERREIGDAKGYKFSTMSTHQSIWASFYGLNK